MKYEKNIAVISTNPTFVRFFELECRLCRIPVRTFSKMPSNVHGYSHVFVDVDTVRHYPTDCEEMIFVSAEAGLNDLVWPLSLETLHSILWKRGHGDVSEVPKADRERVLWIQNRERRELRYEWKTTLLSNNELLILDTLASADQSPVSRASLMAVLDAQSGNLADVYVCHLRKKLEVLCDSRVIDTVRGFGYRLRIPVRQAEEK